MADAARNSPEDAKLAAKWIAELGVSEKAQQPYLTRLRKIQRRYKMERQSGEANKRFAMLWSNTQTILPSVYSRPPEPVVSRRFKDEDPVGRLASEVLERGLSFSIDKQDLDGALRLAAFDFVLCARSNTWERYVPTFGPETQDDVKVLQVTTDAGVCYKAEDGTAYGADGVEERGQGTFYAKGEAYRPLVFEESVTDFVNIEDFGHTPARTWNEVWYVWRRVFMTRKKLVARFGDKLGKQIPLDYPKKENTSEEDEPGQRAAIYEIWDKDAREAIWISKSWSHGPLDKREDPLGLDGFFPCPRPLLGTTTNESLIPVPDYALYQGQAEEIDQLTSKIAQLQEGLRVVGFYAATEKSNLDQLLKAGNTMLIPVVEWQQLQEGGGLKRHIEWFPIDQVVTTLKACIDTRAQLIADVYQITGVADILRGASDPSETAAAQGLKAQWGSVRIRDKQKEVARFARDVLRIKAEVMAEHFAPETLAAMSGVKIPTGAQKAQAQVQVQQMMLKAQAAAQGLPPGAPPPSPPPIPDELQAVLQSPTWDDVVALLRDNAARQFRVDVETDSTIEPNESEEKAQTVELVGALSQMVVSWGPAIERAPQLAPMAAAVTKWAVRRFRAGRELEAVIDQTMDKLAQGGAIAPPQGAGAPAEPPPDKTPVEVAQINLQREQVKQQGETGRAQMTAQIDAAELQLRQGDQQLKGVALARDPQPQGTA